MIEPIRSEMFLDGKKPDEVSAEELQTARDKYLFTRAMAFAIESARMHGGADFPVGGVAARGNQIVGGYYALDRRTGYPPMHAEIASVKEAQKGFGPPADTVLATLEPCMQCRVILGSIPEIKRVGFGMERTEALDRGLIRRPEEGIFTWAERHNYPYEVFKVDLPIVHRLGELLLDSTNRNPEGGYFVDIEAFDERYVALEAETLARATS